MAKADYQLCSWAAGCRSVVRRDPVTQKGPAPDGLCLAHARIAAEIAALPPEEDQVVEESDTEEPPVAIESLRDALRGAVQTSEVAALMESMLLDALRASKKVWHDCPHCKRRSTVNLPDLSTRVSAITKLLESLEGRLKDSVEEEWNTERRQIEARQVALSKLLGVDLGAEIEGLADVLGEDPKSPPDKRFDAYSNEDLARFIERVERKAK